MRSPVVLIALTLSAFMLAAPFARQAPPAAPAPRDAALSTLRWQSIGPANTGGRITAVAGIAGDVKRFYFAGANGGVFHTRDGGVTFEVLFTQAPVYSVGALEIAPSDSNVLWLGTGEGDPRNSASFGNGVYRSEDGGRTWAHLGLDDSEKIKRIAVDPRNADVAWVCALGHTYGPNEMRGVYHTTDAGKTWRRSLFVDADTGCSDVALDPSNPRVLYAGMYTFRRKAWRFDSGGGQTALYRSTDAGDTWVRLSGPANTRGLPKGAMDRVGVAVAASRPSTVYMITESKDEGVLFRSDDRGETWRAVHKNPVINFRPFYYSDIRVDPNDPERVFSLSGSLYLSTDGGRTFETVAERVHPDHQALWIDPRDSQRILNGNDGGLFASFDGGRRFEFVGNIVLSQFYHVSYDMQTPYNVCGGLQDNGNWCGPSRAASRDGIRQHEWSFLSFGDGFWAVPAGDRPWLVYSNTQGGPLYATDLRTGNAQAIHPFPKDIGSTGGPVFDYKYRFNWNAPIALSPHDPKVVYYGGNVIFRSPDYGRTWSVISPDLTTDDKAKQQSSGGEVAQDNTAAEFHCTILTIAESPVTAGVIWAGTDDGQVQVTRDGGKTWTNVVKNIPGVAANAWIPAIEASRFDAGTAYVALDRHRDDDYAPYAFKTTDYGRTWTKVSGNLPPRAYLHVVREDPKARNVLYAGSELGVFATWDGGGTWSSIRYNLPPVAVNDLLVHPRDNDLIVGTHGRGVWILDDISPLQAIDAALGTDAHLFPIRPTHRWQVYTRESMFPTEKQFFGENPPYGAIVTFYAREATEAPASVHVADAGGASLRQFTAPVKAGVNRVAWDLRADAARPVPGQTPPSGGLESRFFGGGGPLVAPGSYRVTLTVAGKNLDGRVEVLADPRLDLPAEGYTRQFAAAIEVRDMVSRVNELVGATERLDKQVAALVEQYKTAATSGAPSEVVLALERALAAVKEYRGRLTRPVTQGLQYRYPQQLRENLSQLAGAIGQGTHAPTDPQTARIAELRTEVGQAVADFQAMQRTVADGVNGVLAGRPHITTSEVR